MNQLVTGDGFLARSPEGNGFTLAIDRHAIGEEDVEVIITSTPKSESTEGQEWEVLGRSALGIVTGIDIARRDDEAAVCDNGSLHIPIAITAHNGLGQRLLERLHELRDAHGDTEVIRWDRRRLPFGRLLRTGGLIQLGDEELKSALDGSFMAVVEHPKADRNAVIEDGVLSLPLEPWELVPNMANLHHVDALQPMLQEGQSARAFAFDNMRAEPRNERHKMDKLVVGAILFAPGPYYAQVVGTESPQGSMTQLPSAAWLDADRSLGLHAEQLPGHRGRQIEVINHAPDAHHSWPDTRVGVRVFKPADGFDQGSIEDWENMSLGARQDRHHYGYGTGV